MGGVGAKYLLIIKGFSGPIGPRVGENMQFLGFLLGESTYFIGFMLPTFGIICKFGGFLWALRAQGWEVCNFEDFCWGKVHILLDLCCQHLGLYVNWGVSVGPSGPGWGNLHFFD